MTQDDAHGRIILPEVAVVVRFKASRGSSSNMKGVAIWLQILNWKIVK